MGNLDEDTREYDRQVRAGAKKYDEDDDEDDEDEYED